MSDVSLGVAPKKAQSPKHKSLAEAQTMAAAPVTQMPEEDIIVTVETDDSVPWHDRPQEEVPVEALVGWDPARKTYKFISNNPALLVRFVIPRRDRNGEAIITQLGIPVMYEIDVIFKNGVKHVSDRQQIELMLRHPSYGGNASKTTQSSEPLYFLDNYPAHEWETIKRRMKFITHEENEHEA